MLNGIDINHNENFNFQRPDNQLFYSNEISRNANNMENKTTQLPSNGLNTAMDVLLHTRES